MNIGSSSSHKSPKFKPPVYFVLVVAAGLRTAGVGRCPAAVMSWVYFTLLTRGAWGLHDQWSATAILRPTFDDGRRAPERRANAQQSLTSSSGFGIDPEPWPPLGGTRLRGHPTRERPSIGCDWGSVGSHDLLGQGSVHWTCRRHWSFHRHPSYHTWS